MLELTYRVKERVQDIYQGHDFSHIERVIKNAQRINEKEQEAEHLVYILALTHDLYDDKFNPLVNIEQDFRKLIEDVNLTESDIQMLLHDLKNFGFKGGLESNHLSRVGQIVSDADRLDAIGAIGIARTMMYGKVLYNDKTYTPITSIEEYRDKNRPILFHFYDKLFKIKDSMFTETGKQLALERHDFMVLYLQQLEKEININILLKNET